MDHDRAQARLHELEQILLPMRAESVERNASDPGVSWRALSLDEAEERVDELADPELLPARREAILGDVRACLSLARNLRENAASSDTLVAALDAELDLWETLLEGAEKDQVDHARNSYFRAWRSRHRARQDHIVRRARALADVEREAHDLRSALADAGVPTDPDSLRRAYEQERDA